MAIVGAPQDHTWRMARDRYRIARDALKKAEAMLKASPNLKLEETTINLIVRWYQQDSEVRAAYKLEDDVLRKFARQDIRKVRRDR